MKGTCTLCGAVLETEPDPIMDEKRKSRERTAFVQIVARHLDPTNRLCTADLEIQKQRLFFLTQDNGWFQRWRLLQQVHTLDPQLLEKVEEWRNYLHILTSALEPSTKKDIQ